MTSRAKRWDIPEAVRRYRDGYTLSSVARFLHVDESKARKLLVDQGVQIRKPGQKAGPPVNSPVREAPQDIRSLHDVPPPMSEVYLNGLNDRWSRMMPDIIDRAFRDTGFRHEIKFPPRGLNRNNQTK